MTPFMSSCLVSRFNQNWLDISRIHLTTFSKVMGRMYKAAAFLRGFSSLRTRLRTAAWKIHGYRVCYVIGDSNTELLEIINRDRLLTRTRLVITSVGGATALGLANPNSKTNGL